MTVDDLLQLVPKLIIKVDSLETELKQTKLTIGKALVKLVKNVKKMEDVLQRRHVVLPDSEDEDAKISSQKGERFTRGRIFFFFFFLWDEMYGSGPVKFCRGQREGKAPMIVEETQAPKSTKEQIQQEESSLAEAIRFANSRGRRNCQTTQHYTEEDWDAIRAKLEANAELTKSVLGKEFPEEDFAKKMVELVNQIKKFFAEERAKARRRTWKLTQLKKLSFEEVKEEFDKLVKQVESFVPINIEATKAQYRRESGKVKEEEPVKRVGKRKKQKARKGISIDKSPQGEILEKKRANGADTVYMSFGAMLKDFTRDDLVELYRLVMQKYRTNRLEDVYDRVLWSDRKTMFDPPLNEDAIWSFATTAKDGLGSILCQRRLPSDAENEASDGNINEQTAHGKDISNPLIADDLLKIIWYYRRFIANSSKVDKPLASLTQKIRKYKWVKEQEEAFQTLKDNRQSKERDSKNAAWPGPTNGKEGRWRWQRQLVEIAVAVTWRWWCGVNDDDDGVGVVWR
ncbi:hypothetical protein Tco_0662514 [Tanacetum coccineum]